MFVCSIDKVIHSLKVGEQVVIVLSVYFLQNVKHIFEKQFFNYTRGQEPFWLREP